MSLTLFLAQFIGWMLLAVGASLPSGQGLHQGVLGVTQTARRCSSSAWPSISAASRSVLTHNIWRGGVLTVVVTLIGWALILRGAACPMFHAGPRRERP